MADKTWLITIEERSDKSNNWNENWTANDIANKAFFGFELLFEPRKSGDGFFAKEYNLQNIADVSNKKATFSEETSDFQRYVSILGFNHGVIHPVRDDDDYYVFVLKDKPEDKNPQYNILIDRDDIIDIYQTLIS